MVMMASLNTVCVHITMRIGVHVVGDLLKLQITPGFSMTKFYDQCRGSRSDRKFKVAVEGVKFTTGFWRYRPKRLLFERPEKVEHQGSTRNSWSFEDLGILICFPLHWDLIAELCSAKLLWGYRGFGDLHSFLPLLFLRSYPGQRADDKPVEFVAYFQTPSWGYWWSACWNLPFLGASLAKKIRSILGEEQTHAETEPVRPHLR